MKRQSARTIQGSGLFSEKLHQIEKKLAAVVMFAEADPGFPAGGTPTLQGAPTYDFAKISKKLYEIEKNLSRRGTRRGASPLLLDPPLIWYG